MLGREIIMTETTTASGLRYQDIRPGTGETATGRGQTVIVHYTGWLEKFFRPQLSAAGIPQQMSIALGWLGIFFGIYLVLPLVYSIANRIVARIDDVYLVVINAMLTFYYLWTILFQQHQSSLALAAAGMSAAHLAMMGVVSVRCREDKQLRQALLVIGLALLTTAIPLYWKMDAAIIG